MPTAIITFFSRLYQHKLTWLLEHMVFAGIPLYLAVLAYADQPLWHYGLLAGSALYMLLVVWLSDAQMTTLGLRAVGTVRAVKQILPGTLLMAGVVLVWKYAGPAPAPSWVDAQSAWVYVFVSVPLQELLFRSLCAWRCSVSWRSRSFVSVFTSLNFAFYHFYLGSWELVLGVFLINLFWMHYYFKHTNLYATIFSHAIIGLAYFLPL